MLKMSVVITMLLLISSIAAADLRDSLEEYTTHGILEVVHLVIGAQRSKDFLDWPLKLPFSRLKEDFEKLKIRLGLGSRHQINELKALMEEVSDESLEYKRIVNEFIEEHYDIYGTDIEECVLLENTDEILKAFSHVLEGANGKIFKALIEKWQSLSKKGIQGSHTLLPGVGQMLIPGGRFREMYYWDTFWVLKGMIKINMHATAKNIISGFVELIRQHGFIPNGTRKYYKNRSQPPLFVQMLELIYEREKDFVLSTCLDAALVEYEFWCKRDKTINISLGQGKSFNFNIYNVETDYPRPEAFEIDLSFAEQEKDLDKRHLVYSELKTAAESGWDFSSRWFCSLENKYKMCIRSTIPADLNAILYRNELILSKFLKDAGNETKAALFKQRAEARYEAMNEILWNAKNKCWNDFNFEKKCQNSTRFYFSNLMPMIFGIRPSDGTSILEILKEHAYELFGYCGGIPASAKGEKHWQNEQWDFPNAWPPFQSLMEEFLSEIGCTSMAYHVARSFFNTVNESFNKNEIFYEKYNCEQLGYVGKDGEYATEIGFGWTNGVMISFIVQYAEQLNKEFVHSESYDRIKQELRIRTEYEPFISEKMYN
ncbi:alpha,alpha-trehalase [Enteropsectra breve]|nr:alpha,alpha-trehalase [Enteropsectra breve]